MRNRDVDHPQVVELMIYLVHVSGDVFVLNDDQQLAVSVFLLQKGQGVLLHVTLLQQVLLRHESKAERTLDSTDCDL